MRISNLFKKIRQMPKRYLAAVAVVAVIGLPLAARAGFGPDRPTFDWNNNPGGCDLLANRGDRCGSISPVFNSFINTPSYGDERNFTRIAEVTPGQSPTDASYAETQSAQPGKEYWVRTLVHNDANQNLNCTPEHRDPATNDCTQIDPGSPGIATGTTVSLEIPSGVVIGVDLTTRVNATNSTPTSVWDTATLANSNQAFSVTYQQGSAVLYNGVHQTGLPLDDSITTAAGVPIGYNQMDGVMPGCFDFSAYVYVRVKVVAPALKFDKLVRMKGEDSTKWRDELTAKTGDHVQYLLDFLDTGTDQVNNIVIRDELPKNIELVPGSVRWIDINYPAPGIAIPDASLFDQAGVLLGNYGVNGGGYVMFEATVKNTDKSVCSPKNVGVIRGDNVPEQKNDATVNISDCNPAVPTVTCDLLTVKPLGNRKYSYKVDYTPKTDGNGVVFKNITFNFGDVSQPLTTNQNPAEHTYQSDGTFATKATVNFTVNGADKSVTGASCAKTISTPTTPTVTTTTLPNTGPGDVIGIFGAVTIAGALVHRYFLGRRFTS